ncbi:MAG: GTP-binding protein [Clostridia bacterium]|nr:GTP-binding protein [Clostridia bacterium]
MTRIDIFSGFLGSGKTTLIKKLLEEAYSGEKIVLIENEFGEIGIDGGFLAEAGIQINEMNSGCICCSLVGDFAAALQKVISEFAPDRILIEPSGVGKLSDVIKAVQGADTQGAVLNGFTTVVDAKKCKMHMKNFGEFFNDQVENAACIVLSHTQSVSDEKIKECVELLKAHNDTAVIVTTPWDQLTGAQLLEAMERKSTLEAELKRLEEQAHEHHHEHEHEHEHHHHDGECCHHDHEHHHHDGECCHHDHEHHHHDGECCHHDHEHHHHDGECCHHDHEHHHHDGECCHHDHEHHHEHHHHEYDEHGNCSCGHHHHDADEVFISFGAETVKKFNADALKGVLESFTDTEKYGMVLKAKGIVAGDDGRWIHFDYIPGEPDVRSGAASVIGRLCVIGSGLDKEAISEALGVEFK